MIQLTGAQAKHYLRQVKFEEAMMASIVIRPRGMAPMLVNSVESLYILFEPNKKSVPGVDFDELELWLANTVGDRELAQAVHYDAGESSFFEHCVKVYHILDARLRQYAEAMNITVPEKTIKEAVAPTPSIYKKYVGIK
ncbi:hypothetical protein SAMN04488540_103147 [Ferrimonas sediminum]|uniref:Uncharacterized protein n=1 Tax=Ferrimonas sediminum TaxID=718193 RepID=A0A1G8NLF8_9GAMM|nr:hypothetical protein [Ferrimonas sediminum]SDI80350.1 hypothetical protein SAMN04488540_103147 [Ferrimonas sediminum]